MIVRDSSEARSSRQVTVFAEFMRAGSLFCAQLVVVPLGERSG